MALAVVKDATLRTQLETGNFPEGAKRIETAAKGMDDAVASFERSTQKASAQVRLSADGFQNWLAKIDPATRAGREYNREIELLDRYQKAGLVSTNDMAIAQNALKQRFEDTGKAIPRDGLGGFNQILTLTKTALGALGIGFTISELVSFGREVFNSTADLKAQAATIGVSTDALQSYRAAAQDVGTSVSESDNALQRFTRSIGEANQGTGAQRKAFQELHLTAADLAAGPQATLPLVAAALLEIKDVTARARIEADLFGRSGQAVEAVLKGWADPEIIAHMKEQGKVIRAEYVDAAAEARKQWQDFFDWWKIQTAAAMFGSWRAPSTPQEREAFRTRDTSKPFTFPFAGEDTLAIANAAAAADAKKNIAPWADEESVKRGTEAAKEYWKTVDDLRKEDTDALDQFHADETAKWDAYYQKGAEDAANYWEGVDKIRAEKNDKADQKYLEDQKAMRAEVEKLWDDYYQHQAEAAQKTADDEIKKREDAEKEAQDRMASGFERLFEGVERTGKFNFRSLFAVVLDDFNRTVAKMVAKWISSGLGDAGGGGGGGGILGGLFSAGLSLFGGGYATFDPSGGWTPGPQGFPEARAAGGPVWAGQSYMVGERGPERFVPRTSGSIIPAGGSTYINIDARGATPGMEQKLLEAATVIAETVYAKNAPSTVAASVRTVNVSRKNTGRN